MKCGDSDLVNTPLMHMGIVSDSRWCICMITLHKLCSLMWLGAYQTEIQPKPKLHIQNTDFYPSRGAQERWGSAGILALEQWKYRSSARHAQSISCSKRRLCLHTLKRCFLSLCLGESKCKRHFSCCPTTWQSSGLLSEVCKDFQRSLNCGGPFQGLWLFM